MAEYKYLSLAGLQHYDEKIKGWVNGLGYALNSDLTKVSDRVTTIENTYDDVTTNAANGQIAYEALTVFMGGTLATQAPTLSQIDSALKTVTVNGKRLFSDAYADENIVLTASDINKGESTVADLLDNLDTNKADKATNLAGYGITDAYTKGEVDDAIADAVSGGVGAVKVTVTDANGTYVDVKGDVDDTGLNITLSVDETDLTNKFNQIDGSLNEKALASDLTALTGRVETAENDIDTIQDWMINGVAITADTKLNATNLPMSDAADATTISTEITSIKNAIQGGTHFIGVLGSLEELNSKNPKSGDIFVASTNFDEFKEDIEYIYDGNNWYELGNSSANAQAIAELTTDKADKATNLAGYGITDAYTKTEVDDIETNLQKSIDDVSGAAVKSIEGGSSTYVTVTAGEKGTDGKVTLTVTDTIGTALDGKLNKTDTAVNSEKLGGQLPTYYATADSVTTVSGKVDAIEKDYVKASEMKAITDEEIDALFATQA